MSSGLALRLPSPLVELRDARLGAVQVLLKRDDLIHPTISGNKWRKVKYLLEDATKAGAGTLLTFGGAYSNHVRALAAAGRHRGIATIAVIRGDERPRNALLAAAEADGMHLHYVDRPTYRRRTDPSFHDELRKRFGDFYLVPEGGTSTFALPGCAEIVAEIDRPFDLIATAVGTGGTLAGLATGLAAGQRALGISTLKGAVSLDDDVRQLHRAALGRPLDNWSIDHRFHHGGFARRSPQLDDFLDAFAATHGLLPDPVYVGKMLFGLFTMVAGGEIADGTVLVALITGPLVADAAPSGRT